jgi:ABC-type dipeptide/oligopeptide/nickel transport system permease component
MNILATGRWSATEYKANNSSYGLNQPLHGAYVSWELELIRISANVYKQPIEKLIRKRF